MPFYLTNLCCMHFALVLGLGFLSVTEGECWMWVCPACIHTPKTSLPLPLAPSCLGVIDPLSRLRLQGLCRLLFACIAHVMRSENGARDPRGHGPFTITTIIFSGYGQETAVPGDSRSPEPSLPPYPPPGDCKGQLWRGVGRNVEC